MLIFLLCIYALIALITLMFMAQVMPKDWRFAELIASTVFWPILFVAIALVGLYKVLKHIWKNRNG